MPALVPDRARVLARLLQQPREVVLEREDVGVVEGLVGAVSHGVVLPADERLI